MLEMLGVLAVMAVLTIGGIAGYNYAINKHRSNIILNDVRRIAVFVLSSKFMEKDDGSIADLDVEVESATPYEVAKESEKTFYITAGRCVDKNDKCPSGEYCVNGTCGCEKGKVKDAAGKCYDCDDATIFQTSVAECNKCPNRVIYSLGYSRNQCTTCPSGSHPDLTRTKCVCGGGEFWNTGSSSVGSICSSCSLSPWEYPFTTLEECHKCSNKYAISFSFNGALGISCADCNIAYGFTLTTKVEKSECDRCNNRYFDTPTSTCKLCPAGQTKNAAGTGCE